jgi:anaerobic ribonucleoside-triphosphate reductase activating protein
MYYGAIKKSDIANGEGIRTSLFVSGCRNACKNCFNKETWAFDYGQPFTDAVAEEIYKTFENPVVAGLTVLGG